MRRADAAKVDSQPVFTATFHPEIGFDGPRAFKALLKIATQKYHLRAVTVREEQAKDAAL
jgi:hypothetical protein